MISRKKTLLLVTLLAFAALVWWWSRPDESETDTGASETDASSPDGDGVAPPSLGRPSLANRIRAALAGKRVAAGDVVDLSGAGRVEGRVVDGSGGAVAGVDVLFRAGGGEATATSDGSGAFTIDLAAGTYDIRAIGDRLISRAAPSLRVVPSDEPQRIEVRVERLATVSGKVVDHGGSGVSGANVHFIPGSLVERSMARGGLLLDRVTTDSSGGFVIDVLAKKQLVLEARAGHLRARAVVRDLAPGSERGGVTIALSEAIEVSGTVADPQGRLIAGAEVSMAVKAPGFSHDQKVETDAAGRFYFEPMTRGAFTLEARADGHAPSIPLVVGRGAVGKGAVSYDLVLQPGKIVSGKVVDGEGRPLAGVRMRLGRGGSSFKALEAYSDGNGVFRFDNVDRAKHWMSAVKGGYATTTVENLEPPRRDLEVTLLPFGAIRGQVRSATGSPLSSFVVRIDTVKQRGVSIPRKLGEATRFSDGSYELSELEPGRYQLTVSAGGYQSAAISVEVPPGDVGNGSATLAAVK